MIDLLLAVHPEEFVAPGGVGAVMVAAWALNNRKNGNGRSREIAVETLTTMKFTKTALEKLTAAVDRLAEKIK